MIIPSWSTTSDVPSKKLFVSCYLTSEVQAYICEGDAFMAMEQYNEAEKSYSIALDVDPSIRRSRSFKVCIIFLF